MEVGWKGQGHAPNNIHSLKKVTWTRKWREKELTAKICYQQTPNTKITKENQIGPVLWTNYRARKQLLMPSRDLSNFSPGGRTGSTEQLREKTLEAGRWICFRFAWKTRCSPKPCAPQSLENAQHSGVFISRKD